MTEKDSEEVDRVLNFDGNRETPLNGYDHLNYDHMQCFRPGKQIVHEVSNLTFPSFARSFISVIFF